MRGHDASRSNQRRNYVANTIGELQKLVQERQKQGEAAKEVPLAFGNLAIKQYGKGFIMVVADTEALLYLSSGQVLTSGMALTVAAAIVDAVADSNG